MGLTVAERLMLLIYRPDGTANGEGTKLDVLVKLDVALAGGLLSELVSLGHAEFADKKVRATTREDQPEHPRLRAALAVLAKKPRNPENTLQALTSGLRKRVRADLVGSGVMVRRGRGLRLPRHELVDPGVRDALNARVRAVIFDGAPPDRDTLLLIPVVFATGLANRVLVEEDPHTVRTRLDELTEKDWLVEGLKRAVLAAKIKAGVGLVVQVMIPAVGAATR